MPRKRKRESPPAIGYQLSIGRPQEAVEEHAWESLLDRKSVPLPPYRLHFTPIWNIRNVVQRLQAFARAYRGDSEPFVLHDDARGKSSIIAEFPARVVAELFTTKFTCELRNNAAFYPTHQFHPFFQVFLDADPERQKNGLMTGASKIEIICNNYLTAYSNPSNLDRHGFVDTQYELNELSKRILHETRNLSEKAKQLRGTAQDTRTRIMQFAYHLITRAPNLFLSHVTIHRAPHRAGNNPISYIEIRKLLKIFTRTLRRNIPDTNYLGYSILLRHNEKIGYWLDAFVYLSDDALNWASVAIDELAQSWNIRIGEKTAEMNYEAWPVHSANEQAVARVLELMTMATEPDFYCRVLRPEGHHAFWCSLSPIGKLAERTKIRKKTAANADRRRRVSPDLLLEERQREADVLRLFQWDQKKRAHQQALSKRRTKAAKTANKKSRGVDT